MVALVFVGVNLLPNLAADAPDGSWWLTCWSGRYLAGVSKPTAEVGAWHTAPRYNQSLNGAVQRLFFVDPGFSDADGDFHETPRAQTMDRQVVKFVALACEAGLVLGCLVVMGRFWRPFSPRPAGQAFQPDGQTGKPDLRGEGLGVRGSLHDVLDSGVVCILMLLLSPMSGKAHFGLLILPGFCLARLAIVERNRSAIIVLGLSVPLILSGRLLTGKPGLYALWWGSVTWHAMLMLAGCLLALRRVKSEAAAGESVVRGPWSVAKGWLRSATDHGLRTTDTLG
jgi:hypothetical protein